jgi:L-lactate dehydrogenase complex protein LldF
MITGPKRANDADGPSEFHLVLIDNGRTKMLAGEFREALQCIRCGACLNICPVYGHIGGHGYGWVYGGPIGAVLTPNYAGLREYRDLPHASSLCEACRDVCPVRIDIPRMLIALRGVEVTRGVTSAFERALFRLTRWVLANPLIFRLSARAGRWGLMPFMRNGRVPKMPLFFGRWTDSRDFPIIAAQTFHARWRELKNKKPDEGDR